MASAILAFTIATTACRDALQTLAVNGTSPAQHASQAEQLFAALGARVADPWRDPKYDVARIRIANSAFLPSHVWNDTAVWVSASTSRRTLLIDGHFIDGRYRLQAARALTPIVEPADSRHVINLTRLAPDQYAWDTDVSYAIGHVSAANVGRFVTALFSAADGRSDTDVRADYRAHLPRTAAALGQLFHVDSIRATTLADRSTLATYVVRLTPAGIEGPYPAFAKYLRRYGESTDMHWILADRAGNAYVECAMSDGRLLLRVRTFAGSLAPLSPALPARPLPDSLSLSGEFTMKVRRFTVGFSEYHADFTVIRTPHERAWSIVSRREPHWTLPLVTERLLKTPLRRPFQGSGASFRIGVRDDSAGGQSVLHRRLHLEVEESLILRFLGRLGAIAVGDYSGDAEREQYAWLRQVFTALVADARAFNALPADTAGPPSLPGP